MNQLFRPRSVDTPRTIDFALRMTAVTLLLKPIPIWYLQPPVIILSALVLLWPAFLRLPIVWGGIALLVGGWVLRTWPMQDNHHYLIAYWTLAICLALLAVRPGPALARSARWLIVGVFLWATLWKALLSPDYMDGRFFKVRLLTDSRFAVTAQVVGGLTPAELEGSLAYLDPAPFGRPTTADPELVLTPALSRFATILTWATVLLEGAVALAFLLPWGEWTLRVRHGALLGFCGAAYAIAPVASFGSILCAMGAAQVPEERRTLRVAYVGVFLLVRFYSDVPWGMLVTRALQLTA